MSLLTWQVKYNTGRDDTDEQHQRLFQMVNDFGEIDDGADREDLSLMFGVIVDYFSEHINEEEKTLQEHSYNEYLNYKQTHSNLISAAGSIKKKLNNKTTSSFRTAVIFLKHLVKLHVSKTHLSFEQSLNARVA